MASRKRRKWLRLVGLALAAGFVLLNGIAWMQSWTATHYIPAGQSSPPIEDLSAPQRAWLMLAGTPMTRPRNDHTPGDAGLAYDVRRIPVGEGESLEAWWMPQTQPHGLVLLFPGYAASKESLLPPATVFHDLGYAALAIDFRGSGGSSGQDTTLGVREAKDVAQTVAYARRTWPDQPLVLFGVSMGGAAVLRAVAQEGVQPAAVILESPFDRLLHMMRNRIRVMGVPTFPSAELMVFWVGMQHGSNGFTHNPSDYATAVQCPALMLHGDQDVVVTTADARAIFDRLAGPKQFVAFPDSGHEILRTTPLSAWQAPVARFLDDLPANPSPPSQ